MLEGTVLKGKIFNEINLYVFCFVYLVSELLEEAFFFTLDEMNCDFTVSA